MSDKTRMTWKEILDLCMIGCICLTFIPCALIVMVKLLAVFLGFYIELLP